MTQKKNDETCREMLPTEAQYYHTILYWPKNRKGFAYEKNENVGLAEQ